MADLGSLRGRRVYVDANVFIYVVEQSVEHAGFVGGLLDLLDAGESEAVTSELTLAEVLVKPFESGRTDIAEIYEEMIAPSAWLSVVPVERAILVEAARLGPALGLRLPDAIHVASAVAARCDLFLTNDRRIKLPAGLARQGLD